MTSSPAACGHSKGEMVEVNRHPVACKLAAVALTALTALAAVLASAAAPLAAEGPHALVRLSLASPGAEDFLRATPLDVVKVKPGVLADIVAGPADLELLRRSGLPLEIVQPDLQAHYRSRLPAEKAFDYGIYHNQAEALALMDSLHVLYPDVVSSRWSIGYTHQLRPIWCFRISDNPEIDEDEPEILFDGMHHAREIMSSEFVLMLAQHLAAAYGQDEEITSLLDDREIYLVPIMNPDGLAVNDWGGMWRKNRRPNPDGSFGVDINRNYPYQWGGAGSSSDPSSDIYRGPYGGSEPEVQALMSFIDSHAFATANSYHTYSNLTLYPWGYTTSPTADDAAFAQLADWLVRFNGYQPGQPGELLYLVSGGTIDWAYGASSHPKIFSFSNEIGSDADGFWPAESRRGPLFQENLWSALCLIRAAGAYLDVEAPAVVLGDGNGRLDPGESAGLSFTVLNRGVRNPASGAVVRLACDDPYVQLGAAERDLGTLGALASLDLGGDPIPITVDAACPGGRLIEVKATLTCDEGTSAAVLSWLVGEPVHIFADDFETGTDGWTLGVSWGTTTAQSRSPAFSLTDSPAGNYTNYAATSALIGAPLRASRISFWHRYAFENGWDYGRVQVRPVGAPLWTTLVSYTGTQSAWGQVDIALGQYAGQELQVRFLLESDGSITADGWYIDDVQIQGVGGGNLAPEPPAQLLPPAGGLVASPVVLTVGPASDPDGPGPLTYGFRIYADELGTLPAAVADDLPGDGSGATWTAPALPPGTYWWRAYAADPVERGLLGKMRSFRIEDLSGAGDLAAEPRLFVLGPSGTGARLALELPHPAAARVRLYDLRGALVRELHSGPLAAGRRLLAWDGRDRGGRIAPSGVYLVRAELADRTLSGRLVLVR